MNEDLTEQDEQEAALWVSRHLDGPVDVMAFAQWMGNKPGRRELFDTMWVDGTDHVVTTASPEHGKTQDVAPLAANDGKPARRTVRGLMALSAVAAAVLVAAAFVWLPMSQVQQSRQIYRTAFGEVREVRLADGSTVLLNGASAIEVQFDEDARHVRLSAGEALFDVSHDADRPFTVKAGTGRVTVLGTRFDLALNGDRVELEVSRGLVRFGVAGADADAAVLVRQAQRSTLADGTTTKPVSSAAPSDPDWRSGWVEVADMPLEQLIPRLQRWTPKTIELADTTLLERRVAGRFMLSEPAAVLSGLGAMYDFRVQETDSAFVIERH